MLHVQSLRPSWIIFWCLSKCLRHSSRGLLLHGFRERVPAHVALVHPAIVHAAVLHELQHQLFALRHARQHIQTLLGAAVEEVLEEPGEVPLQSPTIHVADGELRGLLSVQSPGKKHFKCYEYIK
ncbi:unnamed protein product [Trichogramma brassicae]|uniref:Uncharacterized protein n=1 Tax=Trichogramma brassicae TaxID=86971 RepID=A0A6H5J6U6_9HYME|nr:unnamed protein product [Trichogramma brassicae]